MSQVRIGVLLGRTPPRWAVGVLEGLAARPGVTLAGWTVPTAVGERTRPLLETLDARVFSAPYDPLAAGVPPPDTRLAEDLEAAALDVLIDLSGETPPRELVPRACAALWWPDIGDGSRLGPSIVGLEPLLRRDDAWVQRLLAWDGSETSVLSDTVSRVDHASLHRTRREAAAKARDHILRAVDRLVEGGVRPARAPEEPAPAPSGGPRRLLALLMSPLILLARLVEKDLLRTEWTLVLQRDRAAGGNGPPVVIGTRGRTSLADPCGIDHEGVQWVYFEHLPADHDHAAIWAGRLTDSGAILDARPVVERPWHLSYPFVFDWGGVAHMVFEAQESGTVELLRAVELPYAWEHAGTLLDGVRAADPTIHVDGDRLWMWVCMGARDRPATDDLHVYWADRPEGPWHAHPQNPVVSDVRCARPAGRPYFSGDRLIRPAQDCAGRYGRRVVLREVTQLSEEAYAEEPHGTILPARSPGALGLHTFNAAPGWRLYDLHRYTRGFGALRRWSMRPSPGRLTRNRPRIDGDRRSALP